MRSLTFIALILVAAVIAYLQIASTRTTVDTTQGSTTIKSLPDRVRIDVNAATEKHMKDLRDATEQQ